MLLRRFPDARKESQIQPCDKVRLKESQCVLGFTLKEECRLRLLEKGYCDEYLGPKETRIESREGFARRNFIVYTVHPK